VPFNPRLAERIRTALPPLCESLTRPAGIVEKKMMGGLTFMLRGKMCCGVVGDTLMVRVVEEKYEPSLRKPHCRVMDFTGKPLRGFLFVDPGGTRTAGQLRGWLTLGVEFVGSAPKGKPAPRRGVKKA